MVHAGLDWKDPTNCLVLDSSTDLVHVVTSRVCHRAARHGQTKALWKGVDRIGQKLKEAIKRVTGFPHLLRRMQYPHIQREVRSSKCILDLGCGSGALAQLLSQNARVIGVDRGEFPISFRPAPFRQLQFVNADAADLPFPDGFFDAVAMSSVLQMVEDDRRVLDECRRILRADGHLVLTVPAGYVFIEKLFGAGLIRGRLRRLLSLPDSYESYKALLNKAHEAKGCGFYDRSQLERLLTARGFRILSQQYAPRSLGTFLYEMSMIARWAAGRNVSVFGFGNMILYPVGWFDRLLPGAWPGCELLLMAAKSEPG